MAKESVPKLGPNMYKSPGGGFTFLHQDGNGTVDSGHCVMEGVNDVVLLRRLSSEDLAAAISMIPGPRAGGIPIGWPTRETIELWRKKGYCPCVFALEPGMHLHIGKGRGHLFRKATSEKLDGDDCHFQLRTRMVKDGKLSGNSLCTSVAYDWMFKGCSKKRHQARIRLAG